MWIFAVFALGFIVVSSCLCDSAEASAQEIREIQERIAERRKKNDR